MLTAIGWAGLQTNPIQLDKGWGSFSELYVQIEGLINWPDWMIDCFFGWDLA